MLHKGKKNNQSFSNRGADRMKAVFTIMSLVKERESELSSMGKKDAYHCIREWSGIEGVSDFTIAQALKAAGVKLSKGSSQKGVTKRSRVPEIAKAILSIIDELDVLIGPDRPIGEVTGARSVLEGFAKGKPVKQVGAPKESKR